MTVRLAIMLDMGDISDEEYTAREVADDEIRSYCRSHGLLGDLLDQGECEEDCFDEALVCRE